ncbi:MAG: HigA family addiction module antitoxin [Geminicoccaceae bacterium]
MARTAIHPGELLTDELDERGVKPAHLAEALGVNPSNVSRIIAGTQSVTAEMSLLLGAYFGQSDDVWLNLHKLYDLDVARQKEDVVTQLKRVIERRRKRESV